MKKFMAYWSKHPHYNAFVHVATGLGIGLLVQPYLTGVASTLGWMLVVIGVAGHLYTLVAK